MKKMVSLSIMVLMLFAFGSALYFTEKNVTKAYADEVPSCTTCNVFCWETDGVCHISGLFCLDEDYIGTYYFWYRLDHPEAPWNTIEMTAEELLCNEGCTGFKPYSDPVIRCDNDRYFWEVTKGNNVLDGIQCSGIFYPNGDCEHRE